MNSLRSIKLISLLLALALLLTLPVSAAAATPLEKARTLIDISDTLSKYSIELKDSETHMLEEMLSEMLRKNPELYDQMIEYMFKDLDNYSSFLPAEKYDTAFPKNEPYVGVGLIADAQYPFGLVVSGMVTGGSAEESGLMVGDVVVTVGGENVELLPYAESVQKVRGEAGTKVELKVRRGGERELLSFTLERRALSVSNIDYRNMGDGVALITLERFGSITDITDFLRIYNNIPYDEDIRSVIIDLRNNPGGEISILFNMMNYMIPDTQAILFSLTNGTEHEFFVSTGAGKWTPNELIILVNEHSASCSEIFAGSFQMLGLAKIIGVQTYGKGRSQYHVPVSGGTVVVTAFDISLPDGSLYDGIGITPDIAIEQEYVPYDNSKMRSLDYTKELRYGTASTRVLALQERLAALGIYPCKPNGKYDDMTRWSVNVLQKTGGLTVGDNADVATMTLLGELMAELSAQMVEVDRQLETALKIAREAAIKPLQNPIKPQKSPSLSDYLNS